MFCVFSPKTAFSKKVCTNPVEQTVLFWLRRTQ